LTTSEWSEIIAEVLQAVGHWKKTAKKLGISRAEKELMSAAFKVKYQKREAIFYAP